MLAIAGLCYVTDSFALFVAPAFAAMVSPAILVPGFIGESVLCLWLIVKGVNAAKWKQQASVGLASGASSQILTDRPALP